MSKQEFQSPWWLLPIGRLDPRWWVAVAAALGWVDYLTGPNSQFPVAYVIPVTLAAWYSGRWPAVALAVAMPLIHAALLLGLWKEPGSSATFLLMTTVFRGAVIIAMALWFSRLSELERELRRHVQTLEGLLPICSFCKKIRNESGDWERLEKYIAERSEAKFSHGFCPSCWKTHYSELGDAPPG
jgi:hypothetical protein